MVDGACKISSINQSLVPLLCVVVVAVVVSTVVVVVVVVLVVALESPFKERVLRCWTGRGGPGGWALPLPLPSGGHHRPCCPFVLCLHVCLGLPSAAGRPCGYGALHQRGEKNDTHRLPVARETV